VTSSFLKPPPILLKKESVRKKEVWKVKWGGGREGGEEGRERGGGRGGGKEGRRGRRGREEQLVRTREGEEA
jgi:hypothetical protein